MEFDPTKDERPLEELLSRLRGVQLYMIHMDMPHPHGSPMEYLRPFLREHLLWLEHQEKTGVLFLSGANKSAEEWDGSGTAIIRAESLEAARAIAETEPFHREGLRKNTAHGWLLNEGKLHLTVDLFADNFDLS